MRRILYRFVSSINYLHSNAMNSRYILISLR